MIQVRSLEKYDSNQSQNIIEIIPGNWEPEKWKTVLQRLTASKRQTIFRINHIDDNGLLMVVLRYWLQFNDTITMETKHEWIEKVLEIAFQEKVKVILKEE